METALLQYARRREPHDATPDHGAVAAGAFHPLVDRKLRGAPRERDAGAAVAVIVDDDFLPELLRAHYEPGRAEGAKSDDGADDSVGRDVDARKSERRS